MKPWLQMQIGFIAMTMGVLVLYPDWCWVPAVAWGYCHGRQSALRSPQEPASE